MSPVPPRSAIRIPPRSGVPPLRVPRAETEASPAATPAEPRAEEEPGEERAAARRGRGRIRDEDPREDEAGEKPRDGPRVVAAGRRDAEPFVAAAVGQQDGGDGR